MKKRVYSLKKKKMGYEEIRKILLLTAYKTIQFPFIQIKLWLHLKATFQIQKKTLCYNK